MSKLTQKQVKKLLHYSDGKLFWKVGRGSAKVNSIAGWLTYDGYFRIGINGKIYNRNRIVWLWHNGYFPENQLDHIDRVRHHDYIENLREVSQQCNMRNCINHITNKSGVKGVHWSANRGKWVASLSLKNKMKFLGRYKSFDNAVCARLVAEQCLNWLNCDSSSPAYQYVKNHIQI